MDFVFVEKLLAGLLAAVVGAIVVSKIRGRKLRLPPGPFPVPIFGNWLQVGDDLNHRNLAAMARKFGEVFLLRMGQRNLVVVSSPPLAREVLHTQGVEFGSRTRNVVFDIFTGEGQDMVFTVYGDHWRKMRRIMTVPFFTNKVVQQYRPGWEAEAAFVVDNVRADPRAATEGVVLRRHLQLMMYNNMYRIMFDRRFESMDDPLFLRLRALNGERSRLAQSFEYNYGDFIPILAGYNIPAESKILVNAWFLANNPEQWKRPDEFRPERFLEEEKHVEANGNDFRYLPFGVGRRSCPGIILALPILGITIGRLVQNFVLTPPPGQDKLDTTEKGGQFSLHILKHSTIVAKPRVF
ncbi:unnamed protein product [Triticum turgidum subsp. durum]|uniref:trans-cinnamate 4-monooxygenase n=1 Tax=Triticum turgidum subsp. durum TaxID=4567 RepID=A0A9R1QP99_TRITD|nr:unnamed protein product [Triticum turgidum subsp. durum]